MANSLIHKTLPVASLALVLLLAVPAWASQSDVPPDVVGEVTSVIGVGKVVNTKGEQVALRGQLIRSGDKIETEAGGHVHVRFVDGGLVSIRPLSRLHIEDYRNRDTSQLAAIKFRLDSGVVRSVTGQWGEANRDRFRLNTPVAAIGIKGTDFVVQAQDASTLVSVKTGAIVLAPLEGSCAAALGPCGGERAALLTAEMPGKMLEYLKQNDKSTPRLIPYTDLLARAPMSMQSAEQRQAVTVPTVPTIPSDEFATKSMDTKVKGATDEGAPVARQPLVWLHNALGWNVPANTISSRFDEASEMGRRATVGNFFISLYRDETVRKDFSPPLLTANFGLQSGSANYTADGRASEIASISDAKLTVDFAKSALTTQMNLTSPSMGQERFTATATVSPEGMFANNTATQKLAGAFSTDARQAGYLFEKALSGGSVSGLTLWGR